MTEFDLGGGGAGANERDKKGSENRDVLFLLKEERHEPYFEA
jgi:hypothetical protein